MRPVIGIPCCVKSFGNFGLPNHAVSDHYTSAVLGPVGGLPLLIPAIGEIAVEGLLPYLDGVLLTGSRSNVCPDLYGGPAHCEGTPEDFSRDSTTLPLIRAALAAGLPMLAICRGFQELNVAMGGTLDQRIQDLPDRMDHSTPSDQPFSAVRTGKAHMARVESGSILASLLDNFSTEKNLVPVNSLHNQGICRIAPGLKAEAWAVDGTLEAARVEGAQSFALGVQWHPEYDWRENSLSWKLFEAFGLQARAFRRRRPTAIDAVIAQ